MDKKHDECRKIGSRKYHLNNDSSLSEIGVVNAYLMSSNYDKRKRYKNEAELLL